MPTMTAQHSTVESSAWADRQGKANVATSNATKAINTLTDNLAINFFITYPFSKTRHYAIL
jgi:hypothetical protein